MVTAALAILLIVLVWEGYKWTGQQTGGTWPGTGIELPVSTDDIIMPHASDIAAELVSDIRDGRSTLPLSVFLLKKAWFTLQEAAWELDPNITLTKPLVNKRGSVQAAVK